MRHHELLTDLTDCTYWEYVKSALPILADAMEEAVDSRAGMVRSLRLEQFTRLAKRNGIAMCRWRVRINDEVVYTSWKRTERNMVRFTMNVLVYWISNEKIQTFAKAIGYMQYESLST